MDNSKLKVEIVDSASIGKLQIFECHEFLDGKNVGYKYVNVARLKEKGVIKKANSFKKGRRIFKHKRRIGVL